VGLPLLACVLSVVRNHEKKGNRTEEEEKRKERKEKKGKKRKRERKIFPNLEISEKNKRYLAKLVKNYFC
jgi:hypothetical protein